ncbi:MAG: alpha-amylase family glycosyl hydrolase [Lachnospiraceae bacterium]|nr:alpha-amylase family glycosyl hydrolase [Lachnospiraceae bacterium]
MAWYDEAVYYQIYPLGLLGAPAENDYGPVVHRLRELDDWILHLKKLNVDCIYLGPCFQSGSHGYDTTDYKTVDCRLGDTGDLKHFVAKAHESGIRVIFDGVFNHTGRDFFAFKDIREKREASEYCDFYQGLNFSCDNSYHDGFTYNSWHGIDLLPQLNQTNPRVQAYISDVIRYWVKTFDIDGIRLDAAEDMNIDFLKSIRRTANEVKKDFWLMGEVIHGDYSRFVGPDILHAVTNYQLHKPIYSAHNSHNYFELAYNVQRIYDLAGQDPLGIRLYNFLDNHDVSRIASLLDNPAHLWPSYVLLYTMPGVPSIYYGSEFGIKGRKEDGDACLRPALKLSDYADAYEKNSLTRLIQSLGNIRHALPALSYGKYRQIYLTNRQYAFLRFLDGEGGQKVLITVNNDDGEAHMDMESCGFASVRGCLSGRTIQVENGRLRIDLPANSGEIWTEDRDLKDLKNETAEIAEDLRFSEEDSSRKESAASEAALDQEAADRNEAADSNLKEADSEEVLSGQSGRDKTPDLPPVPDKLYEEMTVAELQAAVLEKMAKNGPVTPEMKKTVTDNIWHDSLVNWVKSFR